MAVDVRVVVDPRKVAAFISEGNGPILRDLLVRGERVKNEARRLVGKKTGNLQSRIVKRVVTNGPVPYVTVGVIGVDYALYHHEGTRPHRITVRNARALRWKEGSEVRFARYVDHPGTKPNRFLTNALRVA